MNRGWANNPFAQACLREICLITARVQCWLKMVFKFGAQNRIPDALFRWNKGKMYKDRFFHETKGFDLSEIRITPDDFRFQHVL